jgi:Inner membrane component of T3SS, cytoplasmic domain
VGVRDVLRKLGLLKRAPMPGRGPIGQQGARGQLRAPGHAGSGPTQELNPRDPQPAASPRYVPRSPQAALATEVHRPAPEPAAAPPPPAARERPAEPAGDAGATRYHYVGDGPKQIVGVLAAVDGPLAGKVFPVGAGETLLGRGGRCRIVLDNEFISREHAKIICQAGQFVIGPHNDEVAAKNPTLLNGSPTAGDALKDGDTIQLGQTTFRFRTL